MGKTEQKTDESKTGLMMKIEPATILELQSSAGSDIPVPKGFADGTEVGSMVPMVQFDKPGDYVSGMYLGVKKDVGENKSRVYLIEVAPGNIVGVWGTTILDQKMDIGTPRHGQSIMIQYLRDVETSRKMNPAHDFRVIIK